MTFSEWKILNFNIQFIFFKPAYFFSTLFAPQPHFKNSEQDCQIAESSENLIINKDYNKDSDLRNKPDKYTRDEAS